MSENNKNINSKDQPLDPSDDTTQPNHNENIPLQCPVCHNHIDNRSLTDTCLHEFCYNCLLEASHTNNRCPVCRQEYNNIIHNIQSENHFQQTPISHNNDRQVMQFLMNARLNQMRYRLINDRQRLHQFTNNLQRISDTNKNNNNNNNNNGISDTDMQELQNFNQRNIEFNIQMMAIINEMTDDIYGTGILNQPIHHQVIIGQQVLHNHNHQLNHNNNNNNIVAIESDESIDNDDDLYPVEEDHQELPQHQPMNVENNVAQEVVPEVRQQQRVVIPSSNNNILENTSKTNQMTDNSGNKSNDKSEDNNESNSD
ncbi:putative uncharacterized protein DDB_G0286901 [Oppia nitens]|uniref:putative uncharacterized protein DDB_G0286901 n=1 Tax=Oppia nitens TaxID=1686743 RepID=UPI0023D9ADB6|nr:putative uncharacterized protein DDB_G0286901 [Oppia nitens]